ncbi:MAG: methyltransferase domain-containing protein [Chloroflexota bacterium]
MLCLSRIVGPQGKVVGADYSEKLIDEAKKRVAKAGVPVELYVGDAHRLTMLADNTFDAARAIAVFHHLENPAIALQEMIRITKPSGVILVGELDWETLLIDHPNRALTRKIVNYMCDRKVRNGWMGRQLPGLFKRFGLLNVQVAPGNLLLNYPFLNLLAGLEKTVEEMAAKEIAPEDATQWLSDLRSFDREDRLSASLGGFTTTGKKLT